MVTPDKAALLALDKASLGNDIDRYLQTLKNPKKLEQVTSYGYQLYQTILQPALAQLPSTAKKLIIIPDGELGYIPFDALPINLAKNGAPTYLFEQYATRREYSATLILEKAKAREVAEEPPLAYAGFAPAYTKSMELPHNQAEVGFLQKLFGGIPYLGSEASEKNFRVNAPNSRIIHYAGHAQASQNAELSGFQFPKPAQPDSVNDGYLYLSELYNLPLKADLAILSACETGAGKLTQGEGIISLARAFHYAGCPTVTMTLWKVNDRATATIVELFSENLSRGMAKDEALQLARLDFLKKEPALSHPYYWAGIVLVGDDSPIANTNWFRWYYWVIALIVGLALVYALTRIGRRAMV